MVCVASPFPGVAVATLFSKAVDRKNLGRGQVRIIYIYGKNMYKDK